MLATKLCPKRKVIQILNSNVREESFCGCEREFCEWWIKEDYGENGNCAFVVMAKALDKIWRAMPNE